MLCGGIKTRAKLGSDPEPGPSPLESSPVLETARESNGGFAEIQARLPRLEIMLELRQVRISGFIWLRNIVEKVEAKHGVSPDEVEEVFLASPQFRRLEKGKIGGEDVYGVYG